MTEDAAAVRQFLSQFFSGCIVSDDHDFFASGFVNSLFALQLVTFVERTFGVTIESEDLDLDNFRTVNAIVGLVARKRALAG
jgi:methoxymalonate biosynthesis acyl carrier protein